MNAIPERAGNPAGRYHPLTISVHWLTLLLLVAVYALIELRGIYPKGSVPRELMKTWHEMLGITVFALVFLRLALRALHPAPVIAPEPPPWQSVLARTVHVLLYAFLVTMPLLGWLMLSAKGKPIPFFGLELPALMRPDKGWAGTIEEVHELVGNAGYFLIGIHAAAALWHHHLRHDNTLVRMLPRLTRGRWRTP